MTVAARLSGVGTFSAFEFDDTTNTSFSISVGSTVFSNEFDENTATTLSGNQRMSATSTGGVIVLDSINEIDPFGDVDTTNLELHLDSVDSNVTSEGTPQGQQVFTSNGTFTVPAGVTQVSAVVVGGGGGGAGSDGDRDEGNTGGGGGGLAYGTFTVTPGESLTVTVGTAGAAAPAGGNGGAGGTTTIARGVTTLLSGGGGQGGQERSTAARAGGASGGTERDGGGTGGSSGSATDDNSGSGGGGAAGYSGNGGAGGSNGGSGSAGAGGGGAGGDSATTGTADGGGGVGILGEGSSGAASGEGGSGGADNSGFDAGEYGGGGGARDDDSAGGGGAGGAGAARIIWGTGRSYPSTLTADQTETSLTYIWEDISGNNRDATFENGGTNPVSGNFINFDGTDDYAATDGTGTGASAYTGVTGTGSRTSIIFFKVDAPNTDYKPLAWGNHVTGEKWTMAVNTSNLARIEIAGGAVEQPSGHSVDVTDGNWHMMAGSAPASGTADDIQMWLDGVKVTGLTVTNGTTSINTASTNYLSVGGSLADASLTPLDGQIAKVLVYNRQLSDLEIKIIYRSILNRLL